MNITNTALEREMLDGRSDSRFEHFISAYICTVRTKQSSLYPYNTVIAVGLKEEDIEAAFKVCSRSALPIPHQLQEVKGLGRYVDSSYRYSFGNHLTDHQIPI